MAVAVGAAGAWACSGGGDEPAGAPPPPTTVAFTAGSVDHSEAGGALSIDVRLTTTLAMTTSDITVNVVDLATGSATSGSDYNAFATQVVTFTAGSVSGDTQSVTLTPIDDSLIEPADEDVVLGLQGPSGAALGGTAATRITLEEVDTAEVAFQNATTLTPDESSTSYDLTLELDLSPGATLGFDVILFGADDASGTATSSADYVALTPVAVNFPAGSADGTTRTVTVQVLDDNEVEGPETFAVALTGAGMNQIITTGVIRHVITISDDEAPPGPTFVATHGATGTETTLASGNSIDLGTQTNNAGPNTGTLLVIANQGSGPMELGAPILSGTDPTDFAIEIDSASLLSGLVAAESDLPREVIDLGAPFTRAAASVLPGTADGADRPGLVVLVDEAALADMAFVERTRLHGFPLPNLGDVTLELERVALPIASDAILMVDGAPVAGGLKAVLSDLTTWKGTVVEIPDSRVFLALTSEGPQGFIELPFEDGRFIHLSPETKATAASPATCRLVHEDDLVALGGDARPPLCSGVEHVPGQPLDLELPGLAAFAPSTAESFVTPNARLAIETDFQLFQKLGSSGAVTAYVTGLIAAVSDMYFDHVQTTMSIAYLGIYTTAADPWSTPDGGGSTSAMLDEFRTAWNASGWPASADLAHFMSGANLGGGIAYVNVLCSQSFGYGVSANLNANIDWGNWNATAGGFTWDFVVVSHELGHNFGASHTHEYCPPIDICSTNCNGTTACSQGTIMSYCHSCGGMNNIEIEIHPQIANVMRTRVESSCLGDAALQPGDSVTYRLRFAPRSGTGAKSATLRFDHDAANAPDPFELTVTGTSQ